jgi:cobalt-zinc-cadmium efflux system membrane fusion protein
MNQQKKPKITIRSASMRLMSIIFMSLIPILLGGCGESHDKIPEELQKSEESNSGVEIHKKSDCVIKDGCFICEPDQREKERLWCKEHHRYEDRCWICHPDLQEKGKLYCTEHGVYEDECYLCHPEIKRSSDDQASSHQKEKESGCSSCPSDNKNQASSHLKEKKILMCNEHGVPEAECAICQPQLATDLAPGQSLKIRISSPETMQKVGVRVSNPTVTTSIDSVRGHVTVDYNHNHLVEITPLVEGIVQEIIVDPGQLVSKGEVLGRIHSTYLAGLKSEFLKNTAELKLASVRYQREKQLSEKKISTLAELEKTKADVDVAQVQLASSRQSLKNLGLTEKDIELLVEQRLPTAGLNLKSPLSGTVVERYVTAGERTEPGDPILKIVDLSSRWLDLSIPSRLAAPLKIGLNVNASFDELPGILVEGELIWISSAVDPKTRRIKARALVMNPPTSLRKGLYGEATINISESTQALLVPTDSIQEIDGIPFVFIKKEPSLFAATRVHPGISVNRGVTPIHKGLNLEDQIVTNGSYILRSEFLKSQLGAGCVDD